MKTFLLSVAFLMIGVVVAIGALFAFRGPVVSWIGETTDKNTQIVNAVTRTQEVALVTLGIEGIRERKTLDGQILFLSIPNSRAAFLRYSFDAKLGFNAEDADVDEQPDGSFVIRIPAFTVIGLNNQKVEVAAENNDLLSWTTPRSTRSTWSTTCSEPSSRPNIWRRTQSSSRIRPVSSTPASSPPSTPMPS